MTANLKMTLITEFNLQLFHTLFSCITKFKMFYKLRKNYEKTIMQTKKKM